MIIEDNDSYAIIINIFNILKFTIIGVIIIIINMPYHAQSVIILIL